MLSCYLTLAVWWMVMRLIWLFDAVGNRMISKKEIYHLTLEAQQAAIDMIKPGVTAHDVDRAVTSVIEKSWLWWVLQPPPRTRYRNGCMNSLHYGRKWHGAWRRHVLLSRTRIYIPGKVGVRIEDCGYVTKDRFGLFTETSKDFTLLWLTLKLQYITNILVSLITIKKWGWDKSPSLLIIFDCRARRSGWVGSTLISSAFTAHSTVRKVGRRNQF